MKSRLIFRKQELAFWAYNNTGDGINKMDTGMDNNGIFNVKQAHKMEDPGRVKDLRPLELLTGVAKITGGDICVDFGSGTGLFALPMAELVGSAGKVYAVDNSPEMLARIRGKNPPASLELVHSDVARIGLNSRIADICLLVCILHEVREPENLIAEASRLLNPDGRLIIVECNCRKI